MFIPEDESRMLMATALVVECSIAATFAACGVHVSWRGSVASLLFEACHVPTNCLRSRPTTRTDLAHGRRDVVDRRVIADNFRRGI